MFSCGTMTTWVNFQPPFCPFAYASTTGQWSVPPFANRYSTPREASKPSHASAAVSGWKLSGAGAAGFGAGTGCSFATGGGEAGLGDSLATGGAFGCSFAAGCDFGCG